MKHDENNLAALNPGQHYESDDLLLYVLGMLTPEEHALVEAHVAVCTQCRDELAAVRDDIGEYAIASVDAELVQSPPSRSRERLLAEIARAESAENKSVEADTGVTTPVSATPEVAATSRPQMELLSGGRPARNRQPRRVAAWIGWGVAAAMAVVAGHFYQDRETMRGSMSAQAGQIAELSAEQARAREIVDALTDRSAQRVSLSLTKAPAAPQPSGRATYLANKGTLIFLASHLDPLPAGKTYELWVIPASGSAPVPAGTFRPDEHGNANVVTAKLTGTGAAKAIGVTIENAGGSTTPTMPIVLAGS